MIGATNMNKYEIRQLDFYRNGLKIDGQLFVPELPCCPLLIISHGFGGNRNHGVVYAKALAENGIAVYIFDFIGGGDDIKSDGKMSEMSVLTEAADLNIVIDGLKKLEMFDSNNIFLSGRSQGGYVSTYVASQRDDIQAMALFYPAYVIQDDVLKRTDNGTCFVPTSTFWDHTVSDLYDRDALSIDIFASMRKYDGKVLIIHGTADDIVPISYSYKALETFPHCELVSIEKAGHGFEGEDEKKALQLILQFIKDNTGYVAD